MVGRGLNIRVGLVILRRSLRTKSTILRVSTSIVAIRNAKDECLTPHWSRARPKNGFSRFAGARTTRDAPYRAHVSPPSPPAALFRHVDPTRPPAQPGASFAGNSLPRAALLNHAGCAATRVPTPERRGVAPTPTLKPRLRVRVRKREPFRASAAGAESFDRFGRFDQI